MHVLTVLTCCYASGFLRTNLTPSQYSIEVNFCRYTGNLLDFRSCQRHCPKPRRIIGIQKS